MGCVKRKPEGKLKGKHILVVEDHPHMGALLMDILKHYDHASYARSGKEAMTEIKQKPPDIVLLDLSLPDMSGLEIARKLRSNQRTKSIPILAMSGSQIEKKACLEAGCNDFILKPFDTSQLLAQLAKLVAHPRGHY
jgi:two-component system, OmpR family, phosphate regulon response regulator PhoB